MQGIPLPPLERRLQKRYLSLVHSHMRLAPELAAEVASLPSTRSAFAATQAAWRFHANARVTLAALVEPLRALACQRLALSPAPFALLVHDWSQLTFHHPQGMRDLVRLTHQTDVGYEATVALVVDAHDGSPLAPMKLHLKTAAGVLSTRRRPPRDLAHLEQVLPTMKASRQWGLSQPLVHVIDREADSVDHDRRWDAAGFRFLIRGDDRSVNWCGKPRLLSTISGELARQGKFHHVRDVSYRDHQAQLWVAETAVTLHRPAKKNIQDRRSEQPGRPLPLRSIIVQLRDPLGVVLAQWMLLSNVPRAWATTAMLAFGYYWRWRIESFFNLLKSHG